MKPTMELAPTTFNLSPAEQQPQTAEELEAQVLKLTSELDDPHSWLHQEFYGALGVSATEMVKVDRPMGGHNLYVKNETEHHMDVDGKDFNASTFKRRGALLAALVAVRDNPDLERFVTASAGNHALGVAFAAKALGKKAHIFCRSDISSAKEAKLVELGAVLHKNDPNDPNGDTLATSMAYAQEASDVTGENGERPNHFIHPFNQVEVIAGQYTVGREIVDGLLAQEKLGRINLHTDPAEIDVAVGGGGHAAGVALAVKEAKDQGKLGNNVKVRGARVEGGKLNTWCDGTATDIGDLPILILSNKNYVESVDEITDRELADAMFELSGVFNKMAEPAGSLSYALAKKRAAAQRMGFAQTTVKPTTHVATFTGANTARNIYDHYTNIRDAAYRHNLESLGNIAAYRSGTGKANPQAARLNRGVLLSGRVLR